MTAPRPELDSNYYLQHFHELLQFVSSQYPHCLTADARQFLQAFAALSTAGQQLLVRMLNRKGTVFADSELHYAEIGPPGPVLDELNAAGLISALTATDLGPLTLTLPNVDHNRMLTLSLVLHWLVLQELLPLALQLAFQQLAFQQQAFQQQAFQQQA